MSDWMGRYRELVAAMVQHTNVIGKSGNSRHYICKDLYLTSNEWQVLEYIVEHRADDEKMILISEALGISQSSFSKISKLLSEKGLIERYKSVDNKKNIILKPTDYALDVFNAHNIDNEKRFKPFFDALATLSDEDINTVASAIEILSKGISESQSEPGFAEKKERPALIKID